LLPFNFETGDCYLAFDEVEPLFDTRDSRINAIEF
jgi:hypothetical protein